jgi:hypothetical protein
MCQAKDAAEDKISSLTSKLAMANQWWEAVKDQCELLVHVLTLLSIKGSELCIKITVAPPLTPLNEGVRLVVARHAEMATWLSVLCVAVSLAAHYVLKCLPVDAPQASIAGEIVVGFRSG